MAVLRRGACPSACRRPPLAYSTSSTAACDVAQPAVDGDVGLGLEQPAEGHELVDAEVVVLDALPGRVLARRAAVAVADAVVPVVAADEIAARPAIDRRVEFLEQRERVGPHAVDVVGRHERDGADAERYRCRRR